MKISVSIEGIGEWVSRMNSIKTKVKDLNNPFKEISENVADKFDKNFPAKGGVIGQGWAARKENKPWPILQKTGSLRKSFTKKSTNKYAEVESKGVKYAKYHQFGTPKMPARPIVGFNKSWYSEISTIILKYLTKK